MTKQNPCQTTNTEGNGRKDGVKHKKGGKSCRIPSTNDVYIIQGAYTVSNKNNLPPQRAALAPFGTI